MNKQNKLSSIMLISFLVVNGLFLAFLAVMAILIGFQLTIFTTAHLVVVIVAWVVDLLYLIYFATMLIVNKIKTK